MRIMQTEMLTSSLIFLQRSFLCPHPSHRGSSEKGCTTMTAHILAGKQRGARNCRAAQQHPHNWWEPRAVLLFNHAFLHIFMQCGFFLV